MACMICSFRYCRGRELNQAHLGVSCLQALIGFTTTTAGGYTRSITRLFTRFDSSRPLNMCSARVSHYSRQKEASLASK